MPSIETHTVDPSDLRGDEEARFEALLYDLLRAFAEISADDHATHIVDGLRLIAEALGLDRSALVEFSDDGTRLAVTHFHARAGIETSPVSVSTHEHTWYSRRLQRREPVVFASVDELPDEAAPERAHCESHGIRSHLAVPVTTQDRVLGAMTCSTIRSRRKWPPELIRKLGIVAAILANALTRVRSEHALQRNQARLREIVESQEEFIVRWLPDGTRTFVNDAYCRFFDDTRERLIGESFLPLIVEDDRKLVMDKVATLTPEQPVASNVHRVIHPDGSMGWQLWTDRAIFDGRGNVVEMQSVGRDITESKRVEEALRESEERYRALVENAPEAIVVLDVDENRFVDVNENAVRMFKLPRADLCKVGPAGVSPEIGPDGQRFSDFGMQQVNRALQGEAPVFEWMQRDAGGREFPCEIRLVRLPSSSRRLLRGSITDITKRRQLELQLRQSQKMEAIGLLAGGIAHDFNNLLTAIDGNAELALDAADPGSTLADELSEIRRAAKRAAGLTRQLLSFSRREIVHKEVVDVGEILGSLTRMLRRLIGEDVVLETSLDPSPCLVEIDPSHLEQIVLNLAVNSREAMPDGGRLSISSRETNGDSSSCHPSVRSQGPGVIIEVGDTGAGIAPEIRQRIFEPFFTTKERGKGTGLGLATVYGIVEQNGGWIVAESDVGQGTTFRIFLPRAERALEQFEAGCVLNPRGTETILLVEDEAIVRDLALRILEHRGYRVLEAPNGDQALSVASGHSGRIDLLLTDVVMPGIGGPELARRLAEQRPETQVLFTSGYTGDVLLRHGVIDTRCFLEKPYSPEELAVKVRELLGEGRPIASGLE